MPAEGNGLHARGGDLTRELDALFRPRSITIVGGSSDPTKLSGMPLRNLRSTGFTGRVAVVNRTGGEIEGTPAYRALSDVPGPIDVALIVVPAEAVEQAVEEAAAASVRVCIIGSSGFAESGDRLGTIRQSKFRAIADASGMRIVGPNTNGIYNVIDGVSIGFNSAHADVVRPGRIAVISHSGALFAAIRGRIEQLGGGLSHFVATGNEADLNMNDFLEYFVGDQRTDVIACVVEALGDGERFRRLARAAHRHGQRVLALKVGQSRLGAAATVAHSSRLAGRASAYEALFAQAGVGTVTTVEALAAAAVLAGGSRPKRGQGIAIVSPSGAGGVLLVDQAARHRVPVAAFSKRTLRSLDRFRRFAPVVNPVDLGATGAGQSSAILSAVARDSKVAAVVCFHYQLQKARTNRLRVAEALVAAHADTGKCVVVVAPGGIAEDEMKILVQGGVQVFADTVVVMEAIAPMFGPRPGVAIKSMSLALPFANLRRSAVLSEDDSRRFLAAAGIPFGTSLLVTSPEAAVAWATSHNGPFAVKGLVAGVEHKAAAGLVRLDVPSGNELALAVAEVLAAARLLNGRVDGVLVAPMVPPGVEAVLGITREPGLGYFLVAGLGGVFTEALADVVMWHLPVNRDEIERSLEATRLGRMLVAPASPRIDGVRLLGDVLLRLQSLASQSRGIIDAIDINPIIINSDGATAVDALIVTGSGPTKVRRG